MDTQKLSTFTTGGDHSTYVNLNSLCRVCNKIRLLWVRLHTVMTIKIQTVNHLNKVFDIFS